MSARKKPGCLTRLLAALISLLCTLVIGGIFYATMVYQLAGEDRLPAQAEDAEAYALALGEGTFLRETEETVTVGGETCSVLTREYALADGRVVLARRAAPAAYVERLSQEGWTPQLITGFVVAGLDAVYETSGERGMLLARDGDAVYLIEGEASEDELYALGIGAMLTNR